jgi:hypothetical protein
MYLRECEGVVEQKLQYAVNVKALGVASPSVHCCVVVTACSTVSNTLVSDVATDYRYKFLAYNRAWLIAQLPSILTPRTLRRGRPYLVNQFTRILNQMNRDISSDSEGDGEGGTGGDGGPKFGPVALSSKSRAIIRFWLAKAKKQLKLREAVQPLINKVSKRERASVCLMISSTKQHCTEVL